MTNSAVSELRSLVDTESKKENFLTIGIGASAGGIKALKEFFAAVSVDSGMAFIVVLHLSPDHKSHLRDILQTETAMPVLQITATVEIEPNHVYVCPPNKYPVLEDGKIRLVEMDKTLGRRVPIDLFFRSLAEAHGKNAVGIILSGTGSDGTLGFKRIKEAGGICIAQEPTEAEYDGMPRSAINTNLVDLILPVAAMPQKLHDIWRAAQIINLPAGEDDDENEADKMPTKHVAEVLREVLTLVRLRTGHDFSRYKHPTILRRVARRLQVHGLESIPAYLEVLRDQPAEIPLLLSDLLISVTNFFRDEEAFGALENGVIPQLFEGKTGEDRIRVWCVASATGEEAYSLAILLSEHASKLADPPKIQIFASDIDEKSIAAARAGCYEETIAVDVSPERLRRFFTREGDYYRVRKEIREMVLFASHNVLSDAPFSQLDLVTCRNLLIYLNRETQDTVLDIFHFALKPDGYLFLGISESAESELGLFAAVDKKQRIYKMRPSAAKQQAIPLMPLANRWRVIMPKTDSVKREPEISFSDLHYKLADRFSPPSVLVNENYDILHSSEKATRFLQFASGEPTRNLGKIAHPFLRPDLLAALSAARQEHEITESRRVRVNLDGAERFVNITVQPIVSPESARGFFLVVFDEINEELISAEVLKSAVNGGNGSGNALEIVNRCLEEDLQHTRDRLRLTVEHHETSVEELRASNEELQAMNEELRSATEELETSKEELQSVNEELTTVNHELKNMIGEVSLGNSDLQNLMAATDIGTIFLDRALQIKLYTPPTLKLFNIIASDIGRPLEHITHRLDYEKLAGDAVEVLETLRTIEREARSDDGKWYVVRLVPYRTNDDRIDGVVVTFVNFTERKHAEVELIKANQQIKQQARNFDTTLSSITDFVYIFDREGRFTFVNQPLLDLWGLKLPEAVGKNFYDLNYPDDLARKLQEQIQRVIDTKQGIKDETPYTSPTGAGGFYEYIFSPVFSEDGSVESVAGSTHEITERKQTEEKLRVSEELLQGTIDALTAHIAVLDKNNVIVKVNKTWRNFAKENSFQDSEYGIGQNYLGACLPPENAEPPEGKAAAEGIRRVTNGELEMFELEYPCHSPHEQRWFVMQVTRFLLSPDVLRVVVAHENVTERKHAEIELIKLNAQIRRQARTLDTTLSTMSDFAYSFDRAGRLTFANQPLLDLLELKLEEAVGKNFYDLNYPDDLAAQLQRQIQEVIETKQRVKDETPFMTVAGDDNFYEYILNPVFAEDGTVESVIGSSRDITEHKRQEEFLKNVARRKDEFLATLAHELRNPLAPIRSGLEIIRRSGSDNAAIEKTLGIIERQAYHLFHLVDDLLDVSRVTQGKIKLKKETFEFKTAVETALETSRELIDAAKIELIVSLPDEPVRLDADLTRIAQILSNILNNAVKYSTQGEKIRLTAEKQAGEIVISVRDTGLGMPPEMLSQIFEIFRQIESPVERARAGLGIGLSVVRSLVEMHDGTVEAFSEGIGRGSEFVIRLPLAPENTTAVVETSPSKETDRAADWRTTENGDVPAKELRVLVVDDNIDAAELLEFLLVADGYPVKKAFDGETAIELAREFHPEVCVLDIGLPVIDGYELARRLREMLPQVLLIALTGWVQAEDRRRSAEAGFDYHLVKPVKFEDLKNLLTAKRT